MHAHVQRLDLVVKMATVLRGVLTEEQHSVLRFMWTKGLDANNIHKEMFPFYGGKYVSGKIFHNWVEKFSQDCTKVAGDA
jgi:hypothetical protein